jgi:hypothetical protein
MGLPTSNIKARASSPLGRLQTKTLGGVDATSYAYNVRSWVTGIPDGMKVVDNGNSYTVTGDDMYNYLGYLQYLNNGTGSMQNLQEALQNASEKNNGDGGNMSSTLNEASVVGQKNPETLKQMPKIKSFEFWIEEKPDNFLGKVAKGMISVLYSSVNSLSITFRGRTLAGFPADRCDDRVLPFVDVATMGLIKGSTALIPLVKTTEGGIEGFNSFMKLNQGAFKGLGWQKEAGKAYQWNNSLLKSMTDFSNAKKILDATSTQQEK